MPGCSPAAAPSLGAAPSDGIEQELIHTPGLQLHPCLSTAPAPPSHPEKSPQAPGSPEPPKVTPTFNHPHAGRGGRILVWEQDGEMAPGAAEQEGSADPFHKHQLISRGGRSCSGRSLSRQSTPSPKAWEPRRGRAGSYTPTDAARKGQHGPDTQPSKRAGFLLPKAQRRDPQVPLTAACPRADTRSGLLWPHREDGSSTPELSSVSSQPAAFPRKSSTAGGRLWGGCKPSRRSATPPESAPRCCDERWATTSVLLPSQGKARSRNTSVARPLSWEQPPSQALPNIRFSSQSGQEPTHGCSPSVRSGLRLPGEGSPRRRIRPGLLLGDGKRKGKGEAKRGGEG